MFLIEDLTAIVLWLLATVMALNFLFLCFVFYRRFDRKRYFVAKDAARRAYEQAVQEFLEGKISTERAFELLKSARTPAERDAVHQLVLTGFNRKVAKRVTDLLFAMGYVESWAKAAFGRRRGKLVIARCLRGEHVKITTKINRGLINEIRKRRLFSVNRAIALDNLGHLSPDYAQICAAEGLHDSSRDVRRVAITIMGRSRHPAAIPLLLEELRKSVEEGNDVSLRSTKSALVAYHMDDLQHFVPFITHPHRRMRFLVVDTAREICEKAAEEGLLNKNDFSQPFYDAMLNSAVTDEFADVRARSAAVVRHFRDADAIRALRRLLKDDNEFVRLHTVRACGDRYYQELLPDVAKLMYDSKWRVREAAAKSLAAFGTSGFDELYSSFLKTSDGYASEQIAEEIQRGGYIHDLFSAMASGGESAQLAEGVCRKLVKMDKCSLLIGALGSTTLSPKLGVLLVDILMSKPSDQILQLVQSFAERDAGPIGDKSRALLRQFTSRSGSRAAASTGGGNA